VPATVTARGRVKAARLPAVKTVDDFDFKAQQALIAKWSRSLAGLPIRAECLYLPSS
jgi:hypothetical protein